MAAWAAWMRFSIASSALCPHVTRIVPGRIKVRRGHTPPNFKVQYPTTAGLKCLYTGTGTVQEVFLICRDNAAAKKWLIEKAHRGGVAHAPGVRHAGL